MRILRLSPVLLAASCAGVQQQTRPSVAEIPPKDPPSLEDTCSKALDEAIAILQDPSRQCEEQRGASFLLEAAQLACGEKRREEVDLLRANVEMNASACALPEGTEVLPPRPKKPEFLACERQVHRLGDILKDPPQRCEVDTIGGAFRELMRACSTPDLQQQALIANLHMLQDAVVKNEVQCRTRHLAASNVAEQCRGLMVELDRAVTRAADCDLIRLRVMDLIAKTTSRACMQVSDPAFQARFISELEAISERVSTRRRECHPSTPYPERAGDTLSRAIRRRNRLPEPRRLRKHAAL